MKKALIITCNDSYDYETRTRYVEQVLKENGYTVEHLLSDFDHRSKRHYTASHPGMIHYIHVPSYSKNISFSRICSHVRFGQQVKSFVMAGEYDLIYHCAPPNYSIMELSKCKKKKSFKLITEVGDMWPESIPVGDRLKNILKIPFGIWSGLRDRYLYNSDMVIAECDLFRETIEKKSTIEQIQTIYFCKEFTGDERTLTYKPGDAVSLCYLGSINNIIDIDMIERILGEMCKKTVVTLHIIGEGEKRKELICAAEKVGAIVEFHGVVFDEKKKKEIFNKCHYALNIMKPEVFVGMTMKSLDYISAGMPIINNIGGDVWKMVETEKNGFNVSNETYKDIVEYLMLLANNDYQLLCKAVRETHQRHFSVERVKEVMTSII